MAAAPTLHLRDHWRWRPEWHADRPCLWWYLTFEGSPAVASLAEGVGRELRASTAVDVVPTSRLHLTLREVGYLDEVRPEALQATLCQADAHLAQLTPFDLELTPVGWLPGAVVLWAAPVGDVERLRGHLPGREPRPPAHEHGPPPTKLAPHVSLAYVNRDCPAREVMTHVARGHRPVRVRVTEVVLAAVTRRQRHYQWEVVRRIPLAAAGSAPAIGPASCLGGAAGGRR